MSVGGHVSAARMGAGGSSEPRGRSARAGRQGGGGRCATSCETPQTHTHATSRRGAATGRSLRGGAHAGARTRPDSLCALLARRKRTRSAAAPPRRGWRDATCGESAAALARAWTAPRTAPRTARRCTPERAGHTMARQLLPSCARGWRGARRARVAEKALKSPGPRATHAPPGRGRSCFETSAPPTRVSHLRPGRAAPQREDLRWTHRRC
jgi:hypothetical protein